MANPRFAGFYIPGAVQIMLGAPIGPGGTSVIIPNLTGPESFPFVLSGRVSDEFATADQNVDTVALQVGLDGEGVYVVTFDRSGTLTINCMATSLVNIAFSTAHNAMRNPIAPLLFTIPVTYRDPFKTAGNGMTAKDCVIQRSAPLSYGATEADVAWTLLSPDMQINHGGRTF